MSAWVTAEDCCARAGAARLKAISSTGATRRMRVMPDPPSPVPRSCYVGVSASVRPGGWALLVAPRHQPLDPADACQVVVDDGHHQHHQHDESREQQLFPFLPHTSWRGGALLSSYQTR